MFKANIDLHKAARFTNASILLAAAAFLVLGRFVSFWFHFGTVTFLLLSAMNFFYRHVQTEHAILRNFGVLGQGRYALESLGPELRQYLFAGDMEERPFTRVERAEVYRKAKGVDSAVSFGSMTRYDTTEIKIRHSLFPRRHEEVEPYRLVFGEERGVNRSFAITKPILISAMSYGALGVPAVRALARGAKAAGIAMNTGEGGWPKHHLEEECDLVFQMGTAKFGVRTEDGALDDARLAELAALEPVRMIEIKLSQGAKPGKGGLLPKEKITAEIAELRGVPMGKDVVSPPFHAECRDLASTVAFVRRVQEVAGLPVGIKTCIGAPEEFTELAREMKRQGVFPDYVAIDGGEGGTGAAPRAYIDYFGMPLLPALVTVDRSLRDLGVRDRMKLIGAGKLINASSWVIGLSLGADAIYSARGFMLALGCIQAMQCGANTCPVGITTHDRALQNGLVVEEKAARVRNYVEGCVHDFEELLGSIGVARAADLAPRHLWIPPDTVLSGVKP